MWQVNVVQKGYSLLLVSQFTLHGYFKGNKPDFHDSMPPADAEALYNDFVKIVQAGYAEDKVQAGQFGADMAVGLVNDGPVTLIIDSENKGGRLPKPEPDAKVKEGGAEGGDGGDGESKSALKKKAAAERKKAAKAAFKAAKAAEGEGGAAAAPAPAAAENAAEPPEAPKSE
jgi:hypothetical protein